MQVTINQRNKVLDAAGELIYDSADDPMKIGCSTFEVEQTAGDPVMVCVEGVHANGDVENGQFRTFTGPKQFCAHGNRVTKVWAKAETSSTTIDSGPLSRNSPQG